MNRSVVDFSAKRAERRKDRVPEKNSRRLSIELGLNKIGYDEVWEQHAASQASAESARIMRSMRKYAGYTQSQMAAALGVTQSRVSYLESGKSSQGPTIGVLYKVAFICRVDLVLSFEKIEPDGGKQSKDCSKTEIIHVSGQKHGGGYQSPSGNQRRKIR